MDKSAIVLYVILLLFGFTIFIKGIKELWIVSPFKTLLVGVFQGFSIALYFMAILQTSVTNAIFLLYTALVFSVILAKYFLKEKIE